MNHFSRVCRSTGKPSRPRRRKKQVARLDSEDSDSETSGRIIDVSNIGTRSELAKIDTQGVLSPGATQPVKMVTDTGVTKTLMNILAWQKVKHQCGKLVKTSKRFRPYGTTYLLPIIGRAQMYLRAENGAQVKTWVYIVNDKKEQCLLGKFDACRLGIVTINLKGAQKEV